MRVYNYRRKAECGPPYHVRRLSPDAGQASQIVHFARNAAVESVDKRCRRCLDISGLGTEETGAVNNSLEVGYIRTCETSSVRIRSEKLRRYLVDGGVGRLCRKDYGYEELEVIPVHQERRDGRILRTQTRVNFGGTVL